MYSVGDKIEVIETGELGEIIEILPDDEYIVIADDDGCEMFLSGFEIEEYKEY